MIEYLKLIFFGRCAFFCKPTDVTLEIPNQLKDFYQNKIMPLQEEQEQYRIALLNDLGFYQRIILIFSLLIVAFMPLSTFGAYLKLAIGTLIFMALVLAMINHKYKFFYKQKMTKAILEQIGGFQYTKISISSDTIVRSELIPPFEASHMSVDDSMIGHYKEVAICLSECTIAKPKQKNKSDKSFHGLIVEMTFNKPFSGHTIIINKQNLFLQALFNKSHDQKELVELEDPEFADKFFVYSTDQVEARYILTTSFIERFLQLSHHLESHLRTKYYLGNKQFSCSFLDNKILFMITAGKDLFELGFVTEYAISPKYVLEYMQDIFLLFSIIDSLKLNNKLQL